MSYNSRVYVLRTVLKFQWGSSDPRSRQQKNVKKAVKLSKT